MVAASAIALVGASACVAGEAVIDGCRAKVGAKPSLARPLPARAQSCGWGAAALLAPAIGGKTTED
jgi:hypothetical protein